MFRRKIVLDFQTPECQHQREVIEHNESPVRSELCPKCGSPCEMSTPTWPTPDSSSVRVGSALTFLVVMSEQDQRAKLGKDTEEVKEGKATTM